MHKPILVTEASPLRTAGQVICVVLAITASACLSSLAYGQQRNDPNEFYKLRTGEASFKYYELGRHAPNRSGRQSYPSARFVAAPDIGLPIKVNPKAGVHMYCNTQVYGLGGFRRPIGSGVPSAGVDSRANYQFPWTSNFCEKRGRSGSASQRRVCGTPYVEHLGQDCRPGRPINRGFEGIAVTDGLVSSLGKGHLVSLSSASHLWTYLHMDKRVVRKNQFVRKGQKLGLISNRPGNTSIHLHLEVQVKGPDGFRHMDPLPSLIVAYRKALGHDASGLVDDKGDLKFDPNYELSAAASSRSRPELPCRSASAYPSIGTETDYSFASLWCHNGSIVGLVETGHARQLVYFKPVPALTNAARRQPVLVHASVSDGRWNGRAVHYSAACEDRSFNVSGALSNDATKLVLSGLRDSFQNRRCETLKLAEQLTFDLIENATLPRPPVVPLPMPKPHPAHVEPHLLANTAFSCPHALKPGVHPKVIAGREVPPKSERTCNFLALTVPQGRSLAEMPRYIREWPGLTPAGFLGDRNQAQIIAFSNQQSGVGAWWYWLVMRARHGVKLSEKGFGTAGRPTLTQLALAMSGRTTMGPDVRQTYLKPYLRFAAQYFGRSVGADEPLSLSDKATRWNLARTQFRLESGRAIVITRQAFECGVRLGNDVMADFRAAGVEHRSDALINPVHFKGLAFYINACMGRTTEQIAALPSKSQASAGRGSSEVASVSARLAAQKVEIHQLKAELTRLKSDLIAKDRMIASIKKLLGELLASLN